MENEDKETNFWVCVRCTSHNHPVDKLCQACRGPREISYPDIPEKLPIPEVFHPYPPREFTNSPILNPSATSRKEVPPEKTKLRLTNGSIGGPNLGPTSVTFSPNNSLLSQSDLSQYRSHSLNLPPSNNEDSSQEVISDITKDKNKDSSHFSTPNYSQNGEENISISDMQICDLTNDDDSDDDSQPLDLTKENGDQTVEKLMKSGDSSNNIRISDSPIDLTLDRSEDSFGMGDMNDLDLIREQSIGGFRTSDFPASASPLMLQKGNQNELLRNNNDVGGKIPGVNRIDKKDIDLNMEINDPSETEPPQTGLNLNLQNSIINPKKPEPAETGLNWNLQPQTPSVVPMFKTTSTMLGSKHLNGPMGALNWQQDEESGSLGLLYPPGSMSNSDQDMNNVASSGSADRDSDNPIEGAKKKNILKKVMPKKTHRPMDLGASSRNKKPKSNFEILSLYDGDVTMDEGDHVTASTRSATVAPPSGSLSVTSNIAEFDPLASSPQESLKFKEDHFSVQETPQQKDDIGPPLVDPVDTAPSPSTLTTPSQGGARRKTTPRRPPATTSTSRPNTSHGSPPQAMNVDEEPSWACPLCTFKNRLSAQFCEICYDGKPPWYEGPPTVTGQLQNQQNQHQLERPIKRSKDSNEKSKAFVEERWVCEAQGCTKINTMKFRYCRSCGVPRPDTPPPSPPKHEQASTSRQGAAAAAGPSTSSMMLSPPPVDAPMLSPAAEFSSLQFFQDTRSATTLSNEDNISGNKIESIMMEKIRQDQERSARDTFNNIEAFCKAAKESFVDDRFPPAPKSLYYPTSLTRPPVEWLRPSEIRTRDSQGRRWTVFCDEGPKSTDIQQGILGNCWFLSGLSALVDRPNLLRKIFLTSEYNPCGVYMIRLCKDGQWQTVIVDDLLPCNKDCELLYTQAIRKQLWVPLIEKALAKINGCYEALQAGRSIEGLATLTGAPCETVQLMPTNDQTDFDPDIVWTVLLSSKNAGFLMGASCGGANMDVNEDIYNRVELRVRHAYGVLDVKEERADDGSMLKLLQLRNPWAQQSWSGDWSDDSDRWYQNPRLRGRLNPTKSGHGIFWLCFTDMLKYFDSVDICKIRDSNWAETRFQGAFPNSALQPPSSYFIEVFQPTEIDFSIFQQGSRSQEGSGRHPVDLSVCVFRSTEKATTARPHSEVPLGPLVVCSKRQVKRHGACSHFFEPGVYQVVTLAFNHWLSGFGASSSLNPSEYPKFVLALHSSRVIQLTNFTASPTLFADATIELVMKKGEQKEVRECASCYYLTRGWAGLIVVAENRHPDRHLHVVCDCEDSNNVVSTRGHFKTSDSIPPLHKQVLIVLTQLDGHSGFTITHKLTHRMSSKGLADWSNVGRQNNEHEPAFSRDVEALHKPRPL